MTGRGREFPPRPLIPVAAAAVVGVLVSVLAILPLCAEICLSGSGTYSKSTIIIVGSAVGCLVLAWLFRARQTLFRCVGRVQLGRDDVRRNHGVSQIV